jgi:hypothetical protein
VNKKYHFGWMWTGITIGLAGMRLSETKKTYASLQYKQQQSHPLKHNSQKSHLEFISGNGNSDLAILIVVFRGFLSPSRKIPGQYLDLIISTSFQILSNSLFTNHPII